MARPKRQAKLSHSQMIWLELAKLWARLSPAEPDGGDERGLEFRCRLDTSGVTTLELGSDQAYYSPDRNI